MHFWVLPKVAVSIFLCIICLNHQYSYAHQTHLISADVNSPPIQKTVMSYSDDNDQATGANNNPKRSTILPPHFMRKKQSGRPIHQTITKSKCSGQHQMMMASDNNINEQAEKVKFSLMQYIYIYIYNNHNILKATQYCIKKLYVLLSG